MKKTLLIAAMALGTLAASAQTVTLSTYAGTDVTRYEGRTVNVSMYRAVLNGWNTIALPFALTTEQLEQHFGADCRLERLVGVESNGDAITLNFEDCKADGIQPNTPYLLHYTGETTTKRLTAQNVQLHKATAAVSFRDVNGVEVTFSAADRQRDAEGLYGIMARDNQEAAFVSVDSAARLYATRCFVELSTGTTARLLTNHLAAGEATPVAAVLRPGEKADVFTLSGARVATRLTPSAITALPSGVYLVNGRKVCVK